MLLGSCFSESIGNRLGDLYFPVDNNPFGIVYNPASVAIQLQRLLGAHAYEPSELFCYNGLWASFDHHSRFSNIDKKLCLDTINTRFTCSVTNLFSANFLFLTFGTSAVYFNIETDKPVSNCHKLPGKLFSRNFLSVSEIVELYSKLIPELKKVNPNLQIVFTVSPVRYLADGAHRNQLNKATLLLAIEELCTRFTYVSYFPSYEILLDDLREYRFYSDDMIHPSTLAVDYIWDKFLETFIDDKSKTLMADVQKITQASQHLPFNSNTEQHQKFVRQQIQKIHQLKIHHNIYMQKEEIIFDEQLRSS